jgi:hypothetical protein
METDYVNILIQRSFGCAHLSHCARIVKRRGAELSQRGREGAMARHG